MDDLIKRTLLRLRGEYMDDEADEIEALAAEVDAIPAIKAERDEYQQAADRMAMEHKVERDDLLQHVDTINRITNDPAIFNLTERVLGRAAKGGAV